MIDGNKCKCGNIANSEMINTCASCFRDKMIQTAKELQNIIDKKQYNQKMQATGIAVPD